MITRRFITRYGRLATMQGTKRSYSQGATPKQPPSPHAQWYSDTVPAMIPIFLLGSAIYLGLQLAQHKLSHEKFMEEATARVMALEAEVDSLEKDRVAQNQTSAAASVPVVVSQTKRPGSWW